LETEQPANRLTIDLPHGLYSPAWRGSFGINQQIRRNTSAIGLGIEHWQLGGAIHGIKTSGNLRGTDRVII
jgi:hypothetical protein